MLDPSLESKHPRHGKIGCGYSSNCECDPPGGSCSSADSDSRDVGRGLKVCISNKLQEITELLFLWEIKQQSEYFINRSLSFLVVKMSLT